MNVSPADPPSEGEPEEPGTRIPLEDSTGVTDQEGRAGAPSVPEAEPGVPEAEPGVPEAEPGVPEAEAANEAEPKSSAAEDTSERINAALAATQRRVAEQLEPVLERFSQQMAAVMAPVVERIAEQLRPQMQEISSLVNAALPKFDPALFPTFTLSPELRETLERLASKKPANWPSDLDLGQLQSVLQVDGIPLVWVPRSEAVADVLAASTREARLALLLERRGECIADCRDALAGATSPTFDGQAVLARQSLDAFAEGHYAAAQALAVVVLESATRVAIHSNSTTTKKRIEAKSDLESASFVELRLWAALAPLVPFFQAWVEGKTPGPRPKALSRHVSVHGAVPEHYTEGNALVAVLLTASVLRALQELEEERVRRGDPKWPW